MTRRVAVFASGGGTNLQSLLDRLNGRPSSGAEVVLVVSDRAGVRALERAARAGVAAAVLPVAGRPPADAAAETAALLAAHEVDVIALAGYLRLVPATVIERYRGRILNIHPALLPSFGGKGMYGLNVHRAVLEAGCTVTGATVHHVTERYDEGRPVAQWPVPVRPGDEPQTLAARVLRVEHVLYPLAIERLARAFDSGSAMEDVAARRTRGTGAWMPGGAAAPVAPDAVGRTPARDSGPCFGWIDDTAALESAMRAAFGMVDVNIDMDTDGA